MKIPSQQSPVENKKSVSYHLKQIFSSYVTVTKATAVSSISVIFAQECEKEAKMAVRMTAADHLSAQKATVTRGTWWG